MLTMHWTCDAQGRLTAHWVEDAGRRVTPAPRPEAPRTSAARPHVPIASGWLLLTHLLVKGGGA